MWIILYFSKKCYYFLLLLDLYPKARSALRKAEYSDNVDSTDVEKPHKRRKSSVQRYGFIECASSTSDESKDNYSPVN